MQQGFPWPFLSRSPWPGCPSLRSVLLSGCFLTNCQAQLPALQSGPRPLLPLPRVMAPPHLPLHLPLCKQSLSKHAFLPLSQPSGPVSMAPMAGHRLPLHTVDAAWFPVCIPGGSLNLTAEIYLCSRCVVIVPTQLISHFQPLSLPRPRLLPPCCLPTGSNTRVTLPSLNPQLLYPIM